MEGERVVSEESDTRAGSTGGCVFCGQFLDALSDPRFRSDGWVYVQVLKNEFFYDFYQGK